MSFVSPIKQASIATKKYKKKNLLFVMNVGGIQRQYIYLSMQKAM